MRWRLWESYEQLGLEELKADALAVLRANYPNINLID